MRIILFRGRPGTGKTTLTHAFAEKSHFPIIRKDDVYDPVAEYMANHADRNKVSHAILYRVLESNLHSDVTFILDFPFQNQRDFSIIKSWCSERCVSFQSILVTCSDERLWAERFNKRADNPALNQLITNFEDLKKHYGVMQLAPEQGELLADTVQPVEDILLKVLECTK